MNGQFVITSLREDDYDLFVAEYNPSGFQSADQKAGNVTLRSGQRMTGVELVLDAGAGDISGLVTDDEGRLISGASIYASHSDDASRTVSNFSDSFGRYRLPNLSAGSYTVWAGMQGYSAKPVRGVAPGEEVDFVLVPVK